MKRFGFCSNSTNALHCYQADCQSQNYEFVIIRVNTVLLKGVNRESKEFRRGRRPRKHWGKGRVGTEGSEVYQGSARWRGGQEKIKITGRSCMALRHWTRQTGLKWRTTDCSDWAQVCEGSVWDDVGKLKNNNITLNNHFQALCLNNTSLLWLHSQSFFHNLKTWTAR